MHEFVAKTTILKIWCPHGRKGSSPFFGTTCLKSKQS